ncbi:MAG TPA: NAD-dependent epimerase/dehydratase family protein [Verrucomicrobiae bacterium]|nr:NAD-dependent epimerase/dehydratase family protein [Verrucomicrobiae bacterium]
MKILVTGTDGYIGVLLAGVLLKRGHDVAGLDTGFYRDGLLYDGLELPRRLVRKDVREVADEDVAGLDAVVHLAELSNDPLGQHNPQLTYAINHRGSVALAERSKRAGVRRFVYSSSCSVYGVASGNAVAEESPTNPQTAYATCKALVERDVSAMADDGFSPTFLRNATAFGASPRMRFDIVLNNLAGLAFTTREIKMVSDGTPWRPLVHVLDICEAIGCALEAPREMVHNQVLNVGDNGQNYRVKEIAECVAEAFPGCALSFGRNDGDNRSYRVSFDKIHQVLPGFRCRRDARTGAHELREVFERIKLTREMFEFRGFTRLKQLEHLLHTQQIDEQFFWKNRP